MSASMAVFTFLNAWWISIFLVLPFRKENTSVKKILLWGTGVAAIITGLLALLANHLKAE